MAASDGLILICGRYEGVDQRFIERCVTQEISLGDFVLSGGEIAALAVIDAAVRLLPGVLNDGDSALQDSFNDTLSGLLDSPHYTRRKSMRARPCPRLLSGHHAQIAAWRRERSLELTAARRPELIEAARSRGLLDKADERHLAALAGLPDPYPAKPARRQIQTVPGQLSRRLGSGRWNPPYCVAAWRAARCIHGGVGRRQESAKMRTVKSGQ